jgi:hypothetical protein
MLFYTFTRSYAAESSDWYQVRIALSSWYSSLLNINNNKDHVVWKGYFLLKHPNFQK